MDEKILSNMMLGTARQAFQPPAAAEGPGELVQNLAGQSSEDALLGSIAASLLFERAGAKTPVTTDPLPEPAPPETLRACSPRSRSHLDRLLEKKDYTILGEWLAAADQAGKRLPEEKLPAMFTLMRNEQELTPAIQSLLGERGKWLAALNPDWALYAGQNLEAARDNWETGSQESRVAFLRRLRATDSDQARTLLAETWSSEGAERRAGLLETFSVNLSMADEPFLEEKLDDRSKEVRRVAGTLLVKLPGSAYVGRMIARANQAIEYIPPKKGFLGFGSKSSKTPFQVTPFESVDASMLRDGLEPKSELQGMGDKAFLLFEVVSRVPPGYWLDRWQVNPHALFRDALESEYAEALMLGWRRALGRYPDDVWSDVFNRYWLGNYEKKLKNYLKPVVTITYPQFEELVFEALKKDGEALWDQHPATFLLSNYKSGSWRPELVRAVVKSLRRRITSSQPNQWVAQREILKALAHHAPPGMIEELSDGWPEDSASWGMWSREVKEFLSLLELRNVMLKEIYS